MEFYNEDVFDSFLDEIEEDLKSVWSSNKSERESAIFSAERSAEADANGLATDAGSGATGSSLSVSSDGSVSSDSSDDSSQTIELDHEHANFKFCATSYCSSSSSSESFELVKPFDFFANNNTDDSENDGSIGTSIEVLDADGNRPEDSMLIG